MTDAAHCEAKLHGFRRTQEGVVVSFVLHPAEIPQALALDPLGTRYMLAFAAIGDDENPVPSAGKSQQPQTKSLTRPLLAEGAHKERRPWDTLPPATQAGILCDDKAFHRFIREQAGCRCVNHIDAADWLRGVLEIDSRKELAAQPAAVAKLHQIRAEFLEWAGRVPVAAR